MLHIFNQVKREFIELHDTAIEVQGVAKNYTIYGHPLQRIFDTLLPKKRDRSRNVFQALREMSFRIQRGEAVGIVGRNGSGKSTLLQIIAGTLQPSEGTINTCGRIAALLELGSGFNPDFTGRENVYMNASILGLSREETDSCFQDIVEFAAIGEYIDRPVNTYSSGMLLRLAFAVQVQIDPDILIIDEALAVGDELFQRKCFAALAAFHQRGGTLLFVSHMGSIVKELCDHVIVLDEGEMVLYADSQGGIDEYHQFLFSGEGGRKEHRAALQERYLTKDAAEQTFRPVEIRGVEETGLGGIDAEQTAANEYYVAEFTSSSRIEYPTESARIKNTRLENSSGEPVNHILPMRKYRFSYDIEFLEDCRHVDFAMMVRSATGLELGGRACAGPGQEIDLVSAGRVYHVSFEFTASLLPGIYYLNCGVRGNSETQTGILARIVDSVVFRVTSDRREACAGYVDLGVKTEIREMKQV